MTGGPGCSSQLAMLFENGPCTPNADGKTATTHMMEMCTGTRSRENVPGCAYGRNKTAGRGVEREIKAAGFSSRNDPPRDVLLGHALESMRPFAAITKAHPAVVVCPLTPTHQRHDPGMCFWVCEAMRLCYQTITKAHPAVVVCPLAPAHQRHNPRDVVLVRSAH